MADESPDISIIFPVYGVEHAVEASLRSVLDQTARGVEVIVVDDCSPDSSMDIVRRVVAEPRYSGKDVTLLAHKKNGGLSAARNTGLRHARGRWVCFVDSDDTIPPTAIQRHLEALESTGATFSDGNFAMHGHRNIFAPYREQRLVKGARAVMHAYYTDMHISACNKLLPRDLLIDHGIFFVEGMLYEDVGWLMQVCGKAESYVCVPHATYDYIIRSGSITRSDDMERSRRRVSSYQRMLAQVAPTVRESRDPAAARWLTRFKVRVKYNVLNMTLPEREKREYFKWSDGKLPVRAGLPYSWLDALPLGALDLILRRPLQVMRKIRKH